MLDHTWQACIDAFLTGKASDSTRVAYRSTVNCFLHDLGDTSPGEASDAQIRAFLQSPSHADHSRGAPITARAAERRRCILSAFYRFAASYLIDGRPLYQNPLPACLSLRYSVVPTPFAHLPIAWQECIAQFLTSIRDLSGSEDSYTSYHSVLAQFFRDRPGSPVDVTSAEVIRFVQGHAPSRRNPSGREVSAGTKNMRRTALNSLYRFASDYEVNGTVLFDRALPTRSIRHLKTAQPYRTMSTSELKRFFAAIDRATLAGKRDYALFWCYFLTARRRNELIGLRMSDIQETIFLERDGTSRPGYQYRYTSKGRSRSVKTAELPVSCWHAITTWLAACGRDACSQSDAPIFTSLHAGQGRRGGAMGIPLSSGYANLLFKAYARKAGLDDKRLSIHSLRHASAGERQLAGQTVQEISAALDHSDPAITWRYLARLRGRSDTGAQLLEARFS